MDRHYDEFSRFFKALGDPSRLQLVHILLQSEGSLSVSALGEQVSIGQSTVSQHLRILKDAGVIRAERRGASIFYQVDRPRLREMGHRFHALFGSLLFEGEATPF